jgi:hypothetical protein
MTDTTHTGKIARLPRNLRNELNQRLANGEKSGPILAWLNALPEVQAVLFSEFCGSQINKQNLSNWRKDGYQHWLKQQDRRDLARELTENAGELATDAEGVELANHFSTVLVAELAAAAREAQAELTDPAERCERLQEFLQTLARVRRQDYLAGKLAIARELRARDRAREKESDRLGKEFQREYGPIFKRSHMADLYAQPDFTSQALAGAQAEALLREAKPDAPQPNGSRAPANPGSN